MAADQDSGQAIPVPGWLRGNFALLLALGSAIGGGALLIDRVRQNGVALVELRGELRQLAEAHQRDQQLLARLGDRIETLAAELYYHSRDERRPTAAPFQPSPDTQAKRRGDAPIGG